jgi:hypothetical protein
MCVYQCGWGARIPYRDKQVICGLYVFVLNSVIVIVTSEYL